MFSYQTHQDTRESQIVAILDDFITDTNPTEAVPNENFLVALAKQEGPLDPHISGVYVLPQFVFAEYK